MDNQYQYDVFGRGISNFGFPISINLLSSISNIWKLLVLLRFLKKKKEKKKRRKEEEIVNSVSLLITKERQRDK